MNSWSNMNIVPPSMGTNNNPHMMMPPSINIGSSNISQITMPPPGIVSGNISQMIMPPNISPMMNVPPPMVPCMPPPFNFNLPPPNAFMYPSSQPIISGNTVGHNIHTTPDEDKLTILKERLNKKCEVLKGSNKSQPSKITISAIKKQLQLNLTNLRQLESQANFLQVTLKSLPDEEWRIRCKEVENSKTLLSNIMSPLDSPDYLKEIIKITKKRKNKILYKKRKAKEWRELKRERKLNSENENHRIDIWLEKMKDEVSRAKREEDIKREADMVLAEVTTKKIEAKRALHLLNSISKLRGARVQALPGNQSTQDLGSEVFNNIIDRLKKMWINKIKEYNTEEQGLKVMLEHKEEKRLSVESAKFRKNLKSWERTIFGSFNAEYSQSHQEFIQTRQDWDRFITTEESLVASSIPLGWVLPSEPSSDEWKKCLITNN